MDRQRGHGAERDETGEMGKPGGCAAFGPLLEAYYHHALEPDAARAVAEHAAGCVACSAALEGFVATDRLIADAPMPAPGPELRQRLAARIATARAHRSDRSPSFAPSMPAERTAVVQDTNDVSDRRGTSPEIPTRAGKGMQRMRVLLGTVAAALVVALLAGALILQTRGTHNQINIGHGNGPAATGECAPANIKGSLPANTWLSDLAMVSPNDGWAVGSVLSPVSSPVSSGGGGAVRPTPVQQSPESARALILRFHNCSWTPVATNNPGARLMSISMDSANDGWAVGMALGKPLALHYTNGAWTSVTLSGQSAPQGGHYGLVRMRSSDEGWIVVESATDQQGNTSSGLLHLAHGRWSAVTMPLGNVTDILPVGQDEAWVAGSASGSPLTPVLYHYQAGAWISATVPSGVFIDRLRMSSPTDIWASAYTIVPLNSESNQPAAVALHYDGTAWAQVNLGQGANTQLVQSFGATAAWAISLQRTDAGETISRMQYGGGSTWQTVQLPIADLLDVSSLVQVAPDEYWAVGHYVTSATGNVANVASVLLYFASGAWHAYGQ